MQWTLICCFFLIAALCLIQGLRKSSFGKSAKARYYCSECGWTTEMVQLCQVEHQYTSTVASLCFDCAVQLEAIPVKSLVVPPSYAAS